MTNNGRPPKSEAVRELHGATRPDRHIPNPKPEIGILIAPDWLGSIGKAEWTRLEPVLRRAGMITQADRSAFEVYCSIYELWVREMTILQKDSGIKSTASVGKKDTDGQYVQNPSHRTLMGDYLDKLRKSWSSLGLSPSDRTRLLAGTPGAEDDPWEDLVGD